MPPVHAPSPFTVALHAPDVLQLADLDNDDVPGACLFLWFCRFCFVLAVAWRSTPPPPPSRPFPAGAVPLQSFRRIPSAGFGSQPLGSLPPSISRSGVVLRKTRHTSPASHHSGSSRVGVMRRSASGGGGAPSNKSPPAPSAPPKSYRIVCARDRTTKRFSVPSSCTYEQFKTACCNSHVSHLIHVPFELSRCVLVLVFRFWFCCVAD
jgi:hypothetical protein